MSKESPIAAVDFGERVGENMNRRAHPALERRAFVTGLIAVGAVANAAAAFEISPVRRELAKIESRTGGRLGVAIVDTRSSVVIEYRARERFPMCSTFKALAVAAVLARVDRGLENPARRVDFDNSDLLAYAPVTRAHVRSGFMTVDALCAAAMTYSDNTAANLLLRTLGGPGGVTRYARTLGDRVTRLDRTEPTLNTAIPGDPRDTTSPLAMAHSLRDVALGSALSEASRVRFVAWLRSNRTGDARLRAGLPRQWRVGDKTGTGGERNRAGGNGTRNDIAIVWPPHRPPLVVTVFLTGSTLAAESADGAIADIARSIAARFRPRI